MSHFVKPALSADRSLAQDRVAFQLTVDLPQSTSPKRAPKVYLKETFHNPLRSLNRFDL